MLRLAGASGARRGGGRKLDWLTSSVVLTDRFGAARVRSVHRTGRIRAPENYGHDKIYLQLGIGDDETKHVGVVR